MEKIKKTFINVYYNYGSYLAPFRRYGGLKVEKSQNSPVRTHPVSKNRPRWGDPLRIFRFQLLARS